MNYFLSSYINTLLWSSTSDEGAPLDAEFTKDDLSPEALAACKADCAKFQADNATLIEQAWSEFRQDDEQVAHDFWLTRNGHGAGFWDGDYSDDCGAGELGDALTKAAKSFRPVDPYVGDDGKIYLA